MINKNELIDMLDNLSKEHKVPAIQVGIIKDNEVIFSGGVGFRDFDKKIEADEETIFAIGSTTKAFTAESIAILVDEGKIEWDKPVKYYIPEFEMYDSYVTENLTVRDMLTHRCGLPRHDLMWYLNTEYSIDDIIQKLRFLKPTAPLRYKFQYSNHMYALAGYLIERVSGQKWNEFVHDRILVPLKMENTNFSVEDTKKVENKALPYKIVNDTINEIPFVNIDAMGADGSMSSTISDMLKWVQFNLDKGQWGDRRIISKKNIEECHMPQMIIGKGMFDEIDFACYGFGWRIESYKGHKIIHHSGGVDGFRATVSFIPEINAGFVVLTNEDQNIAYSIIHYSLYDLLFNSDKADWNERFKTVMDKEKSEELEQINKIRNSIPKNTKPLFELPNYVGEYENSAYGKILLTMQDDKLVFKLGDLKLELEHLCFDSFIIDNIPLQFNIDVTGRIAGVDVKLEPDLDEMIKFTKIS